MQSVMKSICPNPGPRRLSEKLVHELTEVALAVPSEAARVAWPHLYRKNALTLSKPAESYHLSFGLPVATIRPFSTFGPLAWYLESSETFDAALSSIGFSDQVHLRRGPIVSIGRHKRRGKRKEKAPPEDAGQREISNGLLRVRGRADSRPRCSPNPQNWRSELSETFL